MANIVAIIGRPNVGKSTLFNRLVERRDAIMDDTSGVTRDRHYGKVDWTGHEFTVIDTGGYVVGSEDTFEGAIREQVTIAMEEASVLLFVVDCEAGLIGLDKEFANVVRQSKKPVYVVANKADNYERRHLAAEFYELGLGDVFAISAMSGSGTGDLLDSVVTHFEKPKDDELPDLPRISVVGRPNAGKSSFVNLLLNEERSIVTDIAGTTRDSIHGLYKGFGHEFILTDTAGIRKKSKIKENVEFYSVLRAIKSVEDSDVCIVMIDATRGIESQDLNIIHLAHKNRKGIMIMINKWDLVEKETNTARDFEKTILERLAPNDYMPIVFSSVLNKQRIIKAIQTAIDVYKNRQRKIPTSKLNDVMLKEIERTPPPAYRGKYIRIKYITQLPTKAPTFAFFCNFPTHIKEPYTRFLINRMHEHFDFSGVPIKIVYRKK